MKLSSLILATLIAPLFACSSATDMVTQQAEVQPNEARIDFFANRDFLSINRQQIIEPLRKSML